MNVEGEIRCFCLHRHAMSIHLPQMIKDARSGKAYFSQRDNYLVFRDIPGFTGPYAAFFEMKKAKSKSHDAVMFVVSAYEKPSLPKRIPSISFATLTSKVVRGEKIRKPT